MDLLTRIVSTKRLSHAYLFSGIEGIGKRLTAFALAKLLLCSSNGSESCGNCAACIQADRGNHPDLIIIEPKNGTITIDSIRTLKQQLSRKSFFGGYKICIIDEAEKMNVQAENALLKTLEEPSPKTVIILVTGQPYLILPTVRSRCQHLKFQPLPIAIAAQVIMEKRNVDRETASLMAQLTGGSLGKSLALDIEFLKEMRESWIERSKPVAGGKAKDIFDFAGDFCKDKETLALTLNLLRIWYRDLLRYTIYGNSDCLLNKDKANDVALHCSLWNVERLINILLWIEKFQQTLDSNVNPQLTMETLCVTLPSRSEYTPPD
ncbi:MAG: DNA polymerase III subunit delta' [Pseudomonadota bacterium]